MISMDTLKAVIELYIIIVFTWRIWYILLLYSIYLWTCVVVDMMVDIQNFNRYISCRLGP